jgi:heme-degrading monooxygenase HmoA
MAVKIIIKRRVPKEKEVELQPLLTQLRSKAIALPDYISGETLRNVDDPEEYLVISTWKSVASWKEWEASDHRKVINDRIDILLGEKSEYDIYFYGE